MALSSTVFVEDSTRVFFAVQKSGASHALTSVSWKSSGERPIVLPECSAWSLCVGRRMWLIFDFRDKLKRLQHGTTYDSSVLLGGREGVLLYALWFQWAIERYLAEKVMDDEQSIIAEIWWTGLFRIQGFYGMGWAEVLARMLMADAPVGTGGSLESLEHAARLGRWFGDTPTLGAT
eukprot:s1871_g9.t1